MNASYDLARTYELMQRPDDAYRQYAYTLTIDTSFYVPLWCMARIQDNKGNIDSAIILFGIFIEKYPKQEEVYADLSFAYYRLKKYDIAISTNRRALQAIPASVNPLINIGKTYMIMNMPDSALYYFEQASHIQPN